MKKQAQTNLNLRNDLDQINEYNNKYKEEVNQKFI
jgi:hypothetical protein